MMEMSFRCVVEIVVHGSKSNTACSSVPRKKGECASYEISQVHFFIIQCLYGHKNVDD